MKKYLLLLPLLLVALAASCQPGGEETVLLQGAVTIGPISPVETPGASQPVPPEVFSSRHLIIYDESGKKMIREVYFTQIDQSVMGYYTAQIAPGKYVIDINHSGIDTAVTIDVVADETMSIDVNIDTGIR